MAAVIGNLGPFDEKSEKFSDYADRFEAYLAANDIDDDRKVNVFLAVIGPDAYKLLKNLCDPHNPNTRTFTALSQLLQGHYEPAPIVIAERHKFWTATQGESESVSEFVARLKKLASTCSFGEFLLQALRDRLVSGLHPKMSRTQRHLLSIRDLTYAVARDKCIADEMAGKANLEHMGESARSEVHKVQDGSFLNKKNITTGHNQEQSGGNTDKCKSCGSVQHRSESCRYRNATCHHCQRKGHIRPVCKARWSQVQPKGRSSAQKSAKLNSCVSNSDDESVGSDNHVSDTPVNADEVSAFGLYKTETEHLSTEFVNSVKPCVVDVQLGKAQVNCKMEVDTGASRSTVSKRVYDSVLSDYPLQHPGVILRNYSGEKIPVVGKISVPVKYDTQEEILDLIVVEGNLPALFGRDWLSRIKLDWKNMFGVKEEVAENKFSVPKSETFSAEFNSLLEKHKELFSSHGSGIKGFIGSLKLKEGAKPVFMKDRPVPYSLVEKVEKEYDRLVQSDILYPVSCSNWASPVVHVPKSDGSIRVCGDYKGINERIEDDVYKLPSVQDMFAMLSQDGANPDTFSVIDLASAFNQLFLDEESSELLTINTRKGLFKSKRLCFGVKTATSQFQRVMDSILSGIKGVLVRVDDILVATSGGVTAHMGVIKQVLSRLAKHNVRLNGQKCQFFQGQVKYMGHILSKHGISPVKSKLDAIRLAHRPKDVSQLRSFLGMLNYYSKFIKDFSSKLHPLYELLSNKAEWFWTKECEAAFIWAKEVLSSEQVLVHYDPQKPLLLSVDASPYGIGAVLSHRMEDGTERPVEFASRTLSSAEKNYAQIEKEGLAIIFGVKRFQLYLYGRKFTLVTDHQPLTRIFGPKASIPPLAAARLQRWAVLLSGYDFDIVFRDSATNANADFFSRFPLQSQAEDDLDPDEHYVCASVTDDLPVTAVEIGEGTKKDSLLAKVYEYTSFGWPGSCPSPELKPFWVRRDELALENGCLLWGRRVIIPFKFQKRLLEELHECHPGMCRMKALARSFVWWPGIDLDIEDKVRLCNVCTKAHQTPKAVPLLLWPWSTEPWQRIHVDFAEVKGQQFLLVVDSHSKWMEVFPMNSTTANATIEALRTLFARYGLPHELVSDNGPQFVAREFKTFLEMNCIKHTLCPPYHPSTNGLAERHVQTFKHMYQSCPDKGTVQHKVADVLFCYRNTPHTTTDKTPAQLFLKREPRTHLSLVKPSLQRHVEKKQIAAKLYRDGLNPKARLFDLYQPVRVKNTRGGRERWIPGTIVAVKGPETYLVRIPGNNRRFVHANHLIPDDARGMSAYKEVVSPELVEYNPPSEFRGEPVITRSQVQSEVDNEASRKSSVISLPVVNNDGDLGGDNSIHNPDPVITKTVLPGHSEANSGQVVTRSGRVVKPPNRLNL